MEESTPQVIRDFRDEFFGGKSPLEATNGQISNALEILYAEKSLEIPTQRVSYVGSLLRRAGSMLLEALVASGKHRYF